MYKLADAVINKSTNTWLFDESKVLNKIDKEYEKLLSDEEFELAFFKNRVGRLLVTFPTRIILFCFIITKYDKRSLCLRQLSRLW